MARTAVTSTGRWGRAIAAGLLAILVGGAGTVAGASPSGGTTPTGTIYFSRISSPADTLAVAPSGAGLRATGCAGDRSMTTPPRVLRIEPTGTTFHVDRPADGDAVLAEVRLVATDDGCASRRVLLDLPARTTATVASWSLDGRRVAALVRRYTDDGTLADQGVWVGETGGTCGDAVCGFHLAAVLPMEWIAGDGVFFEPPISSLSWSSDGRRVVYGRAPAFALATQPGIFVASLGAPYATAVTEDRQVMVPGGPAFGPAFSPVAGDDRIAYTQRVSTKSCTRNDIFLTTSAGGTATRLMPGSAGVCQLLDPAWSPDGAWFTYSAWSGSLADQQAIYRVKADGSGKPVLVAASRTAVYRLPAWRP